MVGKFNIYVVKKSYFCTEKKDVMKKVLFILSFLTFAAATGFAQTIRNTSNSALVTIDERGVVRNTSNSAIARIGSDGVVRDNCNRYLCKIESNGTVRDRHNSCMGKIEDDGTVRNCNNTMLGKVENDGTVRNRNNHALGSAKGVPMRYAALFFFFDIFSEIK